MKRGARRRNEVLVVTLGIEPQVVTLTLDALLANSFKITHAYVLHPNPQNPQINHALEQVKKEERRFYAAKSIEFRFVPIKEGNHYPTDFVTERDVTLGLKVLYSTVVNLKRQGYRIHLSISGGRKVMTAMGMVVAQLLLDENDQVWHLLSENRVLQSKSMHIQDPNDVILVPVPILRWSLLPSTVNELLVWSDPYKAIQRQRQIQDQQRWQLLNSFWQKLMPSEREVLKALIQYGETVNDLAKRLNKKPKTVRNQLQSIYDKYREHFNLLDNKSKVRERIIADFAPYLDNFKSQ